MDNGPTVHRLWVHMADDEWSSQEDGRKMDNLAREYAAQYAERPMTVTIHEHGGWWLSFLFDGKHDGMIVGTANDMARFSPEKEAIIDNLRKLKTNFLGSIRRHDAMGGSSNAC